jgi:hypothetical protein
MVRLVSVGCFRLAMGTRRDDRDSRHMQPPGSIVVMLRRPARRLVEVLQLYPPDGPWALTPRDDLAHSVPIMPTPRMQTMMPGREGLFYARRTEAGWEIIGPLPANDP